MRIPTLLIVLLDANTQIEKPIRREKESKMYASVRTGVEHKHYHWIKTVQHTHTHMGVHYQFSTAIEFSNSSPLSKALKFNLYQI